MSAEFGIVANVVSDRALRTGAKVWIVHVDGDAERPIVIGLSKNGRRITKRMPFKRLQNFRAAFVPEQMRERVWGLRSDRIDAEARAAKLNERWNS